jgi:hypothetical protein
MAVPLVAVVLPVQDVQGVHLAPLLEAGHFVGVPIAIAVSTAMAVLTVMADLHAGIALTVAIALIKENDPRERDALTGMAASIRRPARSAVRTSVVALDLIVLTAKQLLAGLVASSETDALIARIALKARSVSIAATVAPVSVLHLTAFPTTVPPATGFQAIVVPATVTPAIVPSVPTNASPPGLSVDRLRVRIDSGGAKGSGVAPVVVAGPETPPQISLIRPSGRVRS